MNSETERFFSRAFPGYAWAWPQGDRELLLRAACLPKLNDAVREFRAWEAGREFNDTVGPEQRLLVAISARLPASMITLDERARLTGIERKLWTASRLALRADGDAAAILVGAGIRPLVMKGAARSALDMQNLKGRHAADIDFLVKPEDYRRSIEVLMRNGWTTKHPKLVEKYLSGRGGMAAVNLHKGQYGDADLHQYAFYHVAGASDRGLWARAREVDFLGQKLLVPSPEDNLAIAIAHGGVGAHGQSDWMVDCVNIIRESHIDWNLFEEICTAHRILPYAAIALGFMVMRLEVPVPGEVLARIARGGRQPMTRLWSALLQAHPKWENGIVEKLGRLVARVMRQARAVAWSRRYAADPPVEPPARAGRRA